MNKNIYASILRYGLLAACLFLGLLAISETVRAQADATVPATVVQVTQLDQTSAEITSTGIFSGICRVCVEGECGEGTSQPLPADEPIMITPPVAGEPSCDLGRGPFSLRATRKNYETSFSLVERTGVVRDLALCMLRPDRQNPDAAAEELLALIGVKHLDSPMVNGLTRYREDDPLGLVELLLCQRDEMRANQQMSALFDQLPKRVDNAALPLFAVIESNAQHVSAAEKMTAILLLAKLYERNSDAVCEHEGRELKARRPLEQSEIPGSLRCEEPLISYTALVNEILCDVYHDQSREECNGTASNLIRNRILSRTAKGYRADQRMAIRFAAAFAIGQLRPEDESETRNFVMKRITPRQTAGGEHEYNYWQVDYMLYDSLENLESFFGDDLDRSGPTVDYSSRMRVPQMHQKYVEHFEQKCRALMDAAPAE